MKDITEIDGAVDLCCPECGASEDKARRRVESIELEEDPRPYSMCRRGHTFPTSEGIECPF